MSKIKNISTLEYYNYGEIYNFQALNMGSYRIKISDKDKNIITIDKDGALYGSVELNMEGTTLQLLDASNKAVLCEFDMPNAGEVSQASFNKDENAIVFSIMTLGGEEQLVEIDVNSLITIYEEGSGIVFDNTVDENVKKISIKLAEGEELLQVSDKGLSLDEKVITEEELAKELEIYATNDDLVAETEAREEAISGVTSELESTKEDLSNLEERVDALENSSTTTNDRLDNLEEEVESLGEDVDNLRNDLDELSGTVESNKSEVDDAISELSKAFFAAEYVSDGQKISFKDKNGDEAGYVSLSEIFIDEISPIENVVYNKEEDALELILKSGAVIKLNLSDLLDADEAGEGLFVTDEGKIIIQIDKDSEKYLTVSENGLKLSGIEEILTDNETAYNNLEELIKAEQSRAESAENNLSESIENETSLREKGDAELQSAITQEEEERKSVDKQLLDAINDLMKNFNQSEEKFDNALDEEKNAREKADADLRKDLDAEIVSRKAGDESLKESLQNEVKRIRDEEALLKSEIDSNKTECDRKYEELKALIGESSSDADGWKDAIEAEKLARESEDAVLHGEIESVKNLLKGDAENLTDLGAVEDAIDDIKDTYAKKEYVDKAIADLGDEFDGKLKDTEKTIKEELSAEIEAVKEMYEKEIVALKKIVSDLQTQITLISELPGMKIVEGTYDSTKYNSCEGHGILDVLHCEYHNMEQDLDKRFDSKADVEHTHVIKNIIPYTGQNDVNISANNSYLGE